MQSGNDLIAQIWQWLSEIPDPDIPVISITDLGLVKDVLMHEDEVVVTVTPSYSGCPAMQLFSDEIIAKLTLNGIEKARVKTVFSPAWSSDMISEEARQKMKAHGIAPPERSNEQLHQRFLKTSVNCPWCNGDRTVKKSQFGSTPCKALWYCNSCNQPFEYFKCI
jgi:ring-1,2-phenylacetyl-CoA epoxidase subunit PaaD